MTARVLEIEPGQELVASLGAEGDAWISATGHVEGVEVRVAAEATDPTRALRGRWTLVSLIGPAKGALGVSLARSSDRGLESVGGILVRARSAGVTALVTPLTGSTAPSEPRAARREATIATSSPTSPSNEPENASWSAVAEASDEAADDANFEDEGEPYPVAGDLVDHFSFGLCDVLVSDGERLKIRDIKGPGRIREVSLSALTVPPATRRDGKRLFRLLRKN